MLFLGSLNLFSSCMILSISYPPFSKIYALKISFEFSRSIPLWFFSLLYYLFFSLLFFSFASFSTIFFFILSSYFVVSLLKSGKTKCIILYLTHLYLECRSSTHKPPTHRTWNRATLPNNGTFGFMWNQGDAYWLPVSCLTSMRRRIWNNLVLRLLAWTIQTLQLFQCRCQWARYIYGTHKITKNGVA